jgi:hypothetical protein
MFSAVDFGRGGGADADLRAGACREQGAKKLPAGGRELLGVGQAGERAGGLGEEEILFEDDGGGDHGAGERAAPGFIHAGDAQDAADQAACS